MYAQNALLLGVPGLTDKSVYSCLKFALFHILAFELFMTQIYNGVFVYVNHPFIIYLLIGSEDDL